MIRHAYLTHPQVAIDPAVPVPRWGLSPIGRARIEALVRDGWTSRFARIIASEETKAIEAAEMIARALGRKIEVFDGLHENDRSATGFLPPPEFEATANAFFASPLESVRGWERAIDAQARILRGVMRIAGSEPDTPTLFVGHGGVGTLLKCALSGRAIARSEDQLPNGGGNHFGFTLRPDVLLYDWRAIEDAPP